MLYDRGVSFNSRNNFANISSFAKVSVPAHIIPQSKGFIDFTGMKTRNFFSYACNDKDLLKVFSPWKTCQWSVCAFYAYRPTPKVERTIATHAMKKVTRFPTWNIDMTIQSQVLTMNVLTTSLLYMLQPKNEKRPSTRNPTTSWGCHAYNNITSDSFSHHWLERCVCARENFAHLGSCAKTSIPVNTIISWSKDYTLCSYRCSSL